MPVMTDAQWAKFEAAIAAVAIRGARPRKDERRTIEAIVWRLDNGAKWRSVPAELGPWHHAYLRFRRWTLSGVWDRIMAYVSAQGEPKLAFACIDGTIARAHQKATGARLATRAGKLRIPMHSAHPYRFQIAHRSNLKPPTVLTMPPTLFG